MIVGVGTDITEVARIADLVEKHGERFLNRVFTDEEVAYSLQRSRRNEHLAARFAAKEAVLKAIKTGVGPGTSLREVEVVRGPKGEPEARLHGTTAKVARAKGVRRVHLSLSHTERYGVAFAVCEGAPRDEPETGPGDAKKAAPHPAEPEASANAASAIPRTMKGAP